MCALHSDCCFRCLLRCKLRKSQLVDPEESGWAIPPLRSSSAGYFTAVATGSAHGAYRMPPLPVQRGGAVWYSSSFPSFSQSKSTTVTFKPVPSAKQRGLGSCCATYLQCDGPSFTFYVNCYWNWYIPGVYRSVSGTQEVLTSSRIAVLNPRQSIYE